MTAALLIDVENLVGGLGASFVPVDLEDIAGAIRERTGLSRFTVARAYAPWLDPRLAPLRAQLVTLGIEPVVVFNQGGGNHRNSADILMAVDAIELCLTQPSIQRYTLVSGDGGLAAVVRRLRLYGWKVSIASQEGRLAQLLRGVADEVIILDQPEPVDEPAFRPLPPTAQSEHPVIQQVIHRVTATQSRDPMELARALIRALAEAPLVAPAVQGNGLNPNIFADAFRRFFPNFDPMQVGHARNPDFWAAAAAGSPVALWFRPPGSYVFAPVKQGPMGYSKVEEVEALGMHSVATYSHLLRRAPQPLLSIPERRDLHKVCHALRRLPPSPQMTVADAVEGVFNDCSGLDRRQIKSVIRALIAAGSLQVHGEEQAPFDQRPLEVLDVSEPDACADRLIRIARSKLRTLLPTVSEPVLLALIDPK